ncbi:unnamed protein product [Calypogeia fissa]
MAIPSSRLLGKKSDWSNILRPQQQLPKPSCDQPASATTSSRREYQLGSCSLTQPGRNLAELKTSRNLTCTRELRSQRVVGARAVYREMSEQGSPVETKTNGNGRQYGGLNGGTMVETLDLSPEWIEAWKEELTLASEKEGGVDKKMWNDPLWVQTQIDRRCVDNMRMLAVDSVNTAKAGHPGLPLGITEVGYAIYKYAMRYNPKNPGWFNRDRFVLSAGHGCLLQYICLHLAGFGVELEDLKRLCLLGSKTPGHPENITTPGIEATTGPLGQGVANAVGLALAEKHLAGRFNKPDFNIVDHRTFCVMGDGCAMEGISYEAASLAGTWKLNKLTVLYDDNHNTIDGDTAMAFTEDVGARFRALGWEVFVVDDIYTNLNHLKQLLMMEPLKSGKPTFIQVKSRIGRASVKENTHKAHHGTFAEDDVKQMREKLSWSGRDDFHVIPMVYEEFKKTAKDGAELEEEWNALIKEYKGKYPKEGKEFRDLLTGTLPKDWEKVLPSWKESDPVDATRGYSEKCLNALAGVLPGLIGGSADLASSTKASLKEMDFFSAETPWGRNIHYGVREHAMAGISNGLALHGSNLIPFAATFLIFSDYMKNSMRLASLSEAGVIYILTHDSIGLGEDGPTHQPVEQLPGLRAIPGMTVFRPADGNEMAGAYQIAIKRRTAPTVISCSRQKVEANLAGTSAEKVAKGGYVISDNTKEGELPDIILISTGSELVLCEKAATKLREEGKKARVVSLVSWELFDAQPQQYRDTILPPSVSKRLGVEAASPLGWREYVGPAGHILAVTTFGASGGYLDVFKKFGFTDENVLKQARSLLQG